MILYLDTSAFLKLYLEEAESARVRQLVAETTAATTHLVTYAEMRASFAQAVRMKRMPATDLAYQVRSFESDWLTMSLIGVDEAMVRRAGELAERFGLRGYDSVHLAAAARAFEATGRPDMFVFAAYDKNLCASAEAIGLSCLN